VVASGSPEGDGDDVTVALLRWPAERARAQRLEDSRLPFLLLVGEHEPPPLSGYRFMDWVRSPVDPDELVVRRSNLEDRFVLDRAGPRPRLDEETGRLSFCHSTIDVAPSQVEVLTALLAAYREIVPRADIRGALGMSSTDTDELLASRLVRVRRQVRGVGLDIKRVGRVGYALEPLKRTL
jgi:DNA-binding response OmpR family regulator